MGRSQAFNHISGVILVALATTLVLRAISLHRSDIRQTNTAEKKAHSKTRALADLIPHLQHPLDPIEKSREPQLALSMDKYQRLTEDFKKRELAFVPPPSLSPGQDQTQIAASLVEQGISTYLNAPERKKLPVVATARSLKKVSGNVEVKDEDSDIVHRWDLSLKTLSREAILKYQGYLDAQASFDLRDQALGLSMSKPVSNRSNLYYQIKATETENRNEVGFRYNW